METREERLKALRVRESILREASELAAAQLSKIPKEEADKLYDGVEYKYILEPAALDERRSWVKRIYKKDLEGVRSRHNIHVSWARNLMIGVRPSAETYKTSYEEICWYCHFGLLNKWTAILACANCTGLICACGACGCGNSKFTKQQKKV